MRRWLALPSIAVAALVLLGVAAVTLSTDDALCFNCPKHGMPCSQDSDCYNNDSVFCVLRCEEVGPGEKACLWQD